MDRSRPRADSQRGYQASDFIHWFSFLAPWAGGGRPERTRAARSLAGAAQAWAAGEKASLARGGCPAKPGGFGNTAVGPCRGVPRLSRARRAYLLRQKSTNCEGRKPG